MVNVSTLICNKSERLANILRNETSQVSSHTTKQFLIIENFCLALFTPQEICLRPWFNSKLILKHVAFHKKTSIKWYFTQIIYTRYSAKSALDCYAWLHRSITCEFDFMSGSLIANTTDVLTPPCLNFVQLILYVWQETNTLLYYVDKYTPNMMIFELL